MVSLSPQSPERGPQGGFGHPATKDNMKGIMSQPRLFLCATCAAALALLPQVANCQSKARSTAGPATVPLGTAAELKVPEGYAFIDGKTFQALRKAEGEQVSGEEVGFLQSTNDELAVAFEFSEIGYVKDDEKNDLNADKLLEAYKRGAAAENQQRAKTGGPSVQIIGWDVPPKYDETSHNLEWAIRATIGGEQIVNYNTRLLGRKGVMSVVLIVDPAKLPASLPKFRELLTGYSFRSGEDYASFQPGNKVAKYGLTALVLGGAAVGAAKLGLLTGLLVFVKKAWKLVILGLVALGAAIKRFFSSLFGRRGETIRRE